MKYKTGQRVKVIANKSCHKFEIGEVIKIYSVSDTGRYFAGIGKKYGLITGKEIEVVTHCEMILADLLKGEKLTHLDALNNYDCARLGARIWDLYKEGWPIQREMIKTDTDKWIAQYFISNEDLIELNKK